MCVLGPTLLFGKYVKGELKKFYACSALRENGMCIAFVQPNNKAVANQNKAWKNVPFYNHKKLYLRLNQLMADQIINRTYCHTCNLLISRSDEVKHKDHEFQKCLTNYQLTHPTSILKPLSDAKKEAQFFFSEKTTKDIAQMLLKLKAKHVLCIGVPRLYEYILYNFENEMTCFLLDFDARFVSIICSNKF